MKVSSLPSMTRVMFSFDCLFGLEAVPCTVLHPEIRGYPSRKDPTSFLPPPPPTQVVQKDCTLDELLSFFCLWFFFSRKACHLFAFFRTLGPDVVKLKSLGIPSAANREAQALFPLFFCPELFNSTFGWLTVQPQQSSIFRLSFKKVVTSISSLFSKAKTFSDFCPRIMTHLVGQRFLF